MLIGDRLIVIANSYFETISYWTEKVGLRLGNPWRLRLKTWSRLSSFGISKSLNSWSIGLLHYLPIYSIALITNKVIWWLYAHHIYENKQRKNETMKVRPVWVQQPASKLRKIGYVLNEHSPWQKKKHPKREEGWKKSRLDYICK